MSKCKITVIKKEYYPDLVQKYCQNPASGPCHRYSKTMIACCNDGTRPVIFRLQRIDEYKDSP